MMSGDKGGIFSMAGIRAGRWGLRNCFWLILLALAAVAAYAARPVELSPHPPAAVSGHVLQGNDGWSDRGVLPSIGVLDLSFRNVPGDRLQRQLSLRKIPVIPDCRPVMLPEMRKITLSEASELPGTHHCRTILHHILPLRAGPVC